MGRLIRKPRTVAQPAPLSWRADCSYLITGGLGELGLSVARWMVEQGARRLILMARTKLPPRADWNSIEAGSGPAKRIAAIRELEGMGASVHLASVDVADEDQLGRLHRQVSSRGLAADSRRRARSRSAARRTRWRSSTGRRSIQSCGPRLQAAGCCIDCSKTHRSIS